MGKGRFSLRRRKKAAPAAVTSPRPTPVLEQASGNVGGILVASSAGTSKPGKKKAVGARLWMRFDRTGQSELMECDKSSIIKRASIPARDLRILGPIFSHSSSILEVLPFIDQLRHQLPQKSALKTSGRNVVQDEDLEFPNAEKWLQVPEAVEGLQEELPFEFQVLEVALEVVCTYLDSSVAELERDAYPVLDELAKSVSTRNLEHVRSLKSNLTRLLARVQKVRDEIEHLLDDNEDMAHLYLTRKWIHNQQPEALLLGTTASNAINPVVPNLRRLSSIRSGSFVSNFLNDDVEDLEMLLEAYFMQLEGTRNKILSVREYIDDTEDYVNIQLDNQRNELIQLQLILTIASFAIAVETLVAGWFGMNIHCVLYDIDGIFWPFVGGMTAACIILFFIMLGYARWKKLLGS
ncbi:PREDICTED: magnesium transporter MRS2-4-like isoform X2 [Ipomoea nil]|uniref:magnesium transporter MRS2-4-like isoform X2 n=1 Tax=Ipomoea nil TaxID=35883 RepID=UPI000901D84E|nr:PREDICTED: magnesium transporter MRS2-4-like isoform X2 [Ipomoea nil]